MVLIQPHRKGSKDLPWIIIICILFLSIQGSSAEGLTDPIYGTYQNGSSISFNIQGNITSAQANVSAGTGYYSALPLRYNSEIGGHTVIANRNTLTKIAREIKSAKGVLGKAAFTVYDQSYTNGDSHYSSSGTVQMTIDEKVTDGRVRIGATQKESASSKGATVDQEFTGTFQILQKMAINSSLNWTGACDNWLGCCPPYYCGFSPAGFGQYPAFPYTFKMADQIFS